ncbi:hypothetical protein ABK040_001888 [Willaertia magna]
MSLNNFSPTATKTKTTTTHSHTMNNYTVYNNNTATKTNINGYNNTRISTMKDDEEEEEINQLKRKRFDNEDEDNEEEEDNNDTFENSNLSFCIDNTEEYPSHPFSQSITSNMSSFFYPFHINSTTTTIPSFDKMSYSTIMMNDNNYFINNDINGNNNNNGIIINESKKKCKLSTQHYLIQFLRECIKNYLLQKCKYCNYCLKRFQQQKQQICHKEFSTTTTIMKCKCNNNNNNCNNTTKQNNYSITFGLLLDYIVQQSQLYFDTYNYIKQLTNNSLKKIDNDFKLATNEFEELVIEQLHFVKENDELLRTHSFQLVAAERVAVGDKGDNENNNFFRKSLMMANEEGPLLQSHQQQQLGNSIDSIVDFNTLFQSKTYDNLIGCNDSMIEKTSSGTMNCQFQSDLNDLLFRNNNINWSGLIKKH